MVAAQPFGDPQPPRLAHDDAINILDKPFERPIRAEPALVLALRHALGDPIAAGALVRVEALGIPFDAPPPLLRGRDLRPLGFEPGPEMGEVLDHVYGLQLDGVVVDEAGAREAALAWRRRA